MGLDEAGEGLMAPPALGTFPLQEHPQGWGRQFERKVDFSFLHIQLWEIILQ